MILKNWEDLPEELKLDEVKPYWEALNKKKASLVLKRIFDVCASSVFLIILSPTFLGISIAIKKNSYGPVFFRQERITQYGKAFKIHKFRSMYFKAENPGSLITVNNDSRVTKVGEFLRKYKLDELGQLIDVWQGTMTFVGTRPEVKKYVDQYTPEMMATLLLPAGITSTASIEYADENKLLESAKNVDEVYVNEILPAKMKMNLTDIKQFGFLREIGLCFKTAGAVIKN